SLRIKGKKAAAFGSYGWSGESGKLISSRLEETGNPVMIDPLMIKYRPTTEEIAACREFGQRFAARLQE
ncbi:MAG TPA: MBL fold hydrolase, partial [Clostridiales bacterium]|nr:MBL fold hydrolase [Clostridiales bacterium]